MADGDIFRKLKRVYIKSYKGLCEGKATIAECARSIMTALKLDIKTKGDLPIILAQKMGEVLTQILGEVNASTSVDWGSVNTILGTNWDRDRAVRAKFLEIRV